MNEHRHAQYLKNYLAGRIIFAVGRFQQTITAQDAFNFQRLKLDRLRRRVNFLDIIKKDA